MQVVGSEMAISLLTYGAVPLWAGVIVTAFASFILLLLERLGVRYLEALFAVQEHVEVEATWGIYLSADHRRLPSPRPDPWQPADAGRHRRPEP